MADLKALTYRLMYVGAVLCALIGVAMIYKITTTGDASDEWIVWIAVVLGFCLFGFGFVYEGRSKEQTEDQDTLAGAGGAKAAQILKTLPDIERRVS